MSFCSYRHPLRRLALHRLLCSWADSGGGERPGERLLQLRAGPGERCTGRLRLRLPRLHRGICGRASRPGPAQQRIGGRSGLLQNLCAAGRGLHGGAAGGEHGIPLGEYQFTTYAFRRTDYQNGERTIWSVDCWQAPDGTDEGSFHFIALLDAINGQLLSLNVKPPLNSGLYASDSSDSMELFQVMLPALFEEMGLPTVEAVKPAGDSGGGFLPVQISTASGDYRAAYMVSENTAQLTFLALDGAFLL